MVRLCLEESSDPLKMPWKRGVAMGRAFELLRADAQEHIRLIQREIGFEYCRFHGLFHDDVSVVVRQANGQLAFQWAHVDRICDFLLSVGLRPFVELGPMPAALASGSQTFFHWRMNVTPPRDWEEWRLLIACFAEHCVERYGLEEVRKWYFEVWNEPNLDAFWSGTQADYWKLYTIAAEAIKHVDQRLKVGGPASAEARWIDDFLSYCSESKTPMDFVSTHAYPQNEFAHCETREQSTHRPGMYFIDTVRSVGQKVKNWGGHPLEMHWTEWSSLDAKDKSGVDWYSNDTIDRLYGAALVCHVCTSIDEDADSLFWWVASDIFEEMGMPQSPFSNNFGMVTIDGIPKATFNAFRLLSKMKGERIASTFRSQHEGQGLLATKDGEKIRVLAWNHVPCGMPDQRFEFNIELPNGIATSVRIQAGAGSAYETWLAMGSPQNPTKIQLEALRVASTPRYESRVSSSPLSMELDPGEVWFIEISGPPDPLIPKGNEASVTDSWNEALSAIPQS